MSVSNLYIPLKMLLDNPVIVNSCVQSRAVIEYRFSHGDLGIEILNTDLAMWVWEFRY